MWWGVWKCCFLMFRLVIMFSSSLVMKCGLLCLSWLRVLCVCIYLVM